MRKVLLFFPIVFISIILFSSFDEQEDTLSPAYQTKSYVLAGMLQTMDKFKELLQATRNQDIPEMKRIFKETRLQYKQVEFYLQSFENDNLRYINGPPVPWIEFVGSDTNLMRPEGLQIMEEMLFSDENLSFKRFEDRIFILNNEFIKLKTSIEVNPTSNASVFLGLRYALISIETMTLPAFDCDITRQVSEEATSSLQSIYQVLGFYLSAYRGKEEEKYITHAQKKIQEAQKFLKPNGRFQTYEQLDRLTFIKKYLQPISSDIVDIFELIKTERPSYLRTFRYYISHINGQAKNIYDADFLQRLAMGEKGYYDINNNEKLDSNIIQLGKKLFSDVRLSNNNLLSCQSCHNPKLAFSDGRTTAITNVPGVFQQRNAPSLVYAAYHRRYFTDFRSRTIEDQIDHVMDNPQEFNTQWEQVIQKLNRDSALVQEFAKAFPKDWKKPIKPFTIKKAIAEYERSLARFNSEFDAYMRGETKDIAPEIKRGFNLFMGKARCGICHFAPTFAGIVPPFFRESESEVLGVLDTWDTLNPVLTTDSGRYDFQKNPIYITSHKTPTLRNIALTAPYMHNGQYKDLETVMDFYNRGGGKGMGLDVPNQTLDDTPLNLTPAEIKDIIAFMNSLTDRQFIENTP